MDRRKRDFLLFTDLITAGSHVVAIGANTGITTVPMARKLSTGKVYAFEPGEENYRVLARVMRFFGTEKKIKMYRMALGDSNGTMEMVLPVWGFTRKHGFVHPVTPEIKENNDGVVSSSEVRLLDDLEELKNIKIEFIKIVAENYEYRIFTGAEKTLRRSKPVIYCELWKNEHRHKVLQLLNDYGYEARVFRHGKLHAFNPETDLKKYFVFVPLPVVNEGAD